MPLNYPDDGSGGGPPTGPAGGDLSGTYPNPDVVALHDGATQLSIAGVSDGEFLQRSGLTITSAVPPAAGPAGGDLSGTYPNPDVDAIHSGINQLTIGAIADGEFLVRSGLTIVSGVPTAAGPAGGDLSGTYPNPDVDAIHSGVTQLTIGAITDGQFLIRSGLTIVSAVALQNVVEDTTPQLGGTLDAQGNTIDNVGTLIANGTVPSTGWGRLPATGSVATEGIFGINGGTNRRVLWFDSTNNDVYLGSNAGGDQVNRAFVEAVTSFGIAISTTQDYVFNSTGLDMDNEDVFDAKAYTYEGFQAHGNLGATETINWSLGALHSGTLNSANCTISFTNPTTNPGKFTLLLTQDGAGGRTVTWPTVTWLGNGTAQQPASGAGITSAFTFIFDGATYYGAAINS